MPSRRPAPPRARFIAPRAIPAGALLAALVLPALADPAPLPPRRPAAPAAQGGALAAVRPAAPALSRSVPLPPRRPAELDEGAPDEEAEAAVERNAPAEGLVSVASAPAAPPLPPAAPAPAGTMASPGPAELPEACAALVAEGTLIAAAEPGIAASGSCGLTQPVRLSAVRLHDGRLVEMRPAAIVRCEVATAVADWLREDIAPAADALGAPLDAVKVAASYECRSRNRVAGARMSEHGLGNALDVGGFELADRRVLAVEKGGLPQPLRAGMKESACRRFATVLGPGSDGYHEDHVHVDLAKRARDFKLCRWNLDVGTAVAARKEAPASRPVPKPTATPDSAQGLSPEARAAAAAAGAPVEEEAAPEESAALEETPAGAQPAPLPRKPAAQAGKPAPASGKPASGKPASGSASAGQPPVGKPALKDTASPKGAAPAKPASGGAAAKGKVTPEADASQAKRKPEGGQSGG